jgi:SAM-dependent methyltransferase
VNDKAILADGLVDTQQYDKLTSSNLFKEVEKFSDDFISKVGSMIQSYNIRWVPDPFHQWSRQWEYLYIINQAQKVGKDARIVDLGAGVSFLPYYLKQRLGLKNIVAVDYDTSLNKLYERVNSTYGETIEFQDGDMRNLAAIPDGSVDFAYSVSVLEHTDSYPTVLKEIHRTLKPGGTLSFTFDISLDGLDDIPLTRARELIASLESTFGIKVNLDLDKELQRPNLVTSDVMAKRDKKLMPWKYPMLNIIKHLMKHGEMGHAYKRLTFCCLTVKKPQSP